MGLSQQKVVLDNGYWWQLAKPFEGDRLEYVGQVINSVRIINKMMELAISSGRKLHLHWRDKDDKVIGPQFPEPGKVRCWEQTDMSDWAKIDKSLDKIERLLDEYEQGSKGT